MIRWVRTQWLLWRCRRETRDYLEYLRALDRSRRAWRAEELEGEE